jgi:AraC family L-rhamnose operon regulatory protein RhaS
MAAQCGLGRTAFGRLCHTLTNRTPMAHLAACRVRHACRLLAQDGDQSITDVALASGFGSSQYFATVFARHTGESPQAWRKENRPEEGRPKATTPPRS